MFAKIQLFTLEEKQIYVTSAVFSRRRKGLNISPRAREFTERGTVVPQKEMHNYVYYSVHM